DVGNYFCSKTGKDNREVQLERERQRQKEEVNDRKHQGVRNDESEFAGQNHKEKRVRTSFTKNQIVILEQRFALQKYLTSTERSSLAKELKMSDAQPMRNIFYDTVQIKLVEVSTQIGIRRFANMRSWIMGYNEASDVTLQTWFDSFDFGSSQNKKQTALFSIVDHDF
ncbi:unnamed protein product, partial [Angiostrongylus costaricensis]|uniref:Homeobox domain-containing protein n=1 Tax=Angiostrongylus costaricensis TaxID=334426 RepID=A0A158PM45_ANGCS